MKQNSFFMILALCIGCFVGGSCTTTFRTNSLKSSVVQIHHYASAGVGSVNTWWIETKNSVIIIDFQRDDENARAAIQQIRTLGKPVSALLLTHAHPDHIGGLEIFKQTFPQIPLYSSELTRNEIRDDSRGYQKLRKQMLKDKAPKSYPVPDHVFKGGETLTLDALQIQTYEFGPSESVSATVYYLPDQQALFTGDLVANKAVDFFLERRTGYWLKALKDIADIYPKAEHTYPGHGDQGRARDLLAHQREYIEFYRSKVMEQVRARGWNGHELTPEAQKAVAAAVEARYPDFVPVSVIPNLVQLNANAIAMELIPDVTD